MGGWRLAVLIKSDDALRVAKSIVAGRYPLRQVMYQVFPLDVGERGPSLWDRTKFPNPESIGTAFIP